MQGIIGLLALVLAVVAIINVVKSARTGGQKALWIVVILIFPFIGSIVYFVIGNKKAA
ncbi:MAG: hypothetical protein MOGMAGMI_01593 [Candidatus Omnitrophica bacterium]|nr:hypothetical protein [Candidatus Omnitrophota bacterium]